MMVIFKNRRGLFAQSLLATLMAAAPLFAQSPPPSPDRPWRTMDGRQIASEGERIGQPALSIEPGRAY